MRSSQQALHFAAQAVMSGAMDCVIAAGVESMSRLPMAALSGIYKDAGLGHYMSPTIRARYPGPEFSQFLGAEMMAEKYQLSRDALDCYSQTIALAPARLNVNGDAIALGHPLGASGTRLMTTLVHALQARGKRYGLQTMCEGGGQANVTIVEGLG